MYEIYLGKEFYILLTSHKYTDHNITNKNKCTINLGMFKNVFMLFIMKRFISFAVLFNYFFKHLFHLSLYGFPTMIFLATVVCFL